MTMIEVLEEPLEKQQEWIDRNIELDLIVKKIEKKLNAAKDRESAAERRYKQGAEYRKQMRFIAERFDEADKETQRGFIREIYSKIELSNGYRVKLFLNEDYMWMLRMMKDRNGFSSHYRRLRAILKEQ